MVPIRRAGHGFYRDRGKEKVRLHRMEGTVLPTGKFRCEIPDESGEMQSLYITLVLIHSIQVTLSYIIGNYTVRPSVY